MDTKQIVNELTFIISDISSLYAKYEKDDIYDLGVKLAELNKRIEGGK